MKALSKPIIEKALDEQEKAGKHGARILRGLYQVRLRPAVVIRSAHAKSARSG